MKKILLLLTTLLFIGCQQPSNSIAVVQVDDDKTQAIQKLLENYMAYGTDSYEQGYDQSLISDDLTGNNSVPGFDVTAESFMATDAQHHALFENIKMWMPGEDDGTGGGLHTNYYDEFGTWTHYWGTWSATGRFTGNEVSQFIHLNWGWNDEGQIIYHNVHADGKDIWEESNAAEAASKN